MTCRVLILDFDRGDLFKASKPETIARTSRGWKRDIQDFGPWNRVRDSRFEDAIDAWAWQPDRTGDGPDVLVCGHSSSTMDTAWHFIDNRRIKTWDSVMAVEQSAGRGQQKRQWISPAGNIHASWLWPLPEITAESTPDWGGLLPLVAGFIFSRVFKELNVPVRIKWPNDLLINDRKFGGILVERRGNHILVGTGINVTYSPEDRLLREEFAVPATHLSDQGYDITPLFLWTTLVEKGKFLLENLIQTATPAEFIKTIDMHMAWVGKNVLVRQVNTDIFEAKILGLAADGGLRIKKGNMESVMYSGSIIPA